MVTLELTDSEASIMLTEMSADIEYYHNGLDILKEKQDRLAEEHGREAVDQRIKAVEDLIDLYKRTTDTLTTQLKKNGYKNTAESSNE